MRHRLRRLLDRLRPTVVELAVGAALLLLGYMAFLVNSNLRKPAVFDEDLELSIYDQNGHRVLYEGLRAKKGE